MPSLPQIPYDIWPQIVGHVYQDCLEAAPTLEIFERNPRSRDLMAVLGTARSLREIVEARIYSDIFIRNRETTPDGEDGGSLNHGEVRDSARKIAFEMSLNKHVLDRLEKDPALRQVVKKITLISFISYTFGAAGRDVLAVGTELQLVDRTCELFSSLPRLAIINIEAVNLSPRRIDTILALGSVQKLALRRCLFDLGAEYQSRHTRLRALKVRLLAHSPLIGYNPGSTGIGCFSSSWAGNSVLHHQPGSAGSTSAGIILQSNLDRRPRTSAVLQMPLFSRAL